MIGPQKFIESFLKARAAVYAEANARLAPLFEECFGPPLAARAGDFLMRDVSRVVFDDIRESPGSATVVTRDPALKGPIARTRYHLSTMEGTWRVVRLEHQCFFCQGSMRSGADVCPKCNGEGWYDNRKSNG